MPFVVEQIKCCVTHLWHRTKYLTSREQGQDLLQRNSMSRAHHAAHALSTWCTLDKHRNRRRKSSIPTVHPQATSALQPSLHVVVHILGVWPFVCWPDRRQHSCAVALILGLQGSLPECTLMAGGHMTPCSTVVDVEHLPGVQAPPVCAGSSQRQRCCVGSIGRVLIVLAARPLTASLLAHHLEVEVGSPGVARVTRRRHSRVDPQLSNGLGHAAGAAAATTTTWESSDVHRL
jgi:hypothetical protein